MQLTFKLALRTEHFDPATLRELAGYTNPTIEITRYGYTEPLKQTVDPEHLDEIVELYEHHVALIFRGRRKLWLSLSANQTGTTLVGGGIDAKSASVPTEVLPLLELFARDNQLLHGYLCSNDEYDQTHKVIEGSGVSWKGVSQWDFLEFLPGVHWYTIFGRELVRCIGADRFDALVGVRYTETGDESVAFHLDEPVDTHPGRQAQLAAIERQIGAAYFFGRDKPQGSYRHPQAFKTYLESFGTGY